MADPKRTSPDAEGDYLVGYGKPPREHQFPPGQSGNVKGRPPKSRNLKSVLAEVMAEPVVVSQKGRRTKVSTDKALLLRMREKALNGDIKAIALMLQLCTAHLPQATGDGGAHEMSAEDRAIVEAYLAALAGERT